MLPQVPKPTLCRPVPEKNESGTMPSIRHKFPIADELRQSLKGIPVRDLMIGEGKDGDAGILGTLYQMIGNIAGALELAYRRGYELGEEAERKKHKRKRKK